jgi:hypothetical protein
MAKHEAPRYYWDVEFWEPLHNSRKVYTVQAESEQGAKADACYRAGVDGVPIFACRVRVSGGTKQVEP